MARSGRKRKFKGHLGAGGDGDDGSRRPDDRVRTSRQPHRRVLDDADRRAEEAESPIGRLLLAGHLKTSRDVTGEEPRDRYLAATLFATAVGAYRSVIGAPSTTGGGGGKGYECDVDLCAVDPERCICLQRKTRYRFAYESLAAVGRHAVLAVNRVVIYREPITAAEIVYLVAGLDALVTHFGLTNRRREHSIRNTQSEIVD